jgi:hypothetical protein
MKVKDYLTERNPQTKTGWPKKAKGKAKTWEEVRDKPMRVFLQTTVVLKARDFADAEWQVLNAFEKKKPKVKGMVIEKFSVDAIDEL